MKIVAIIIYSLKELISLHFDHYHYFMVVTGLRGNYGIYMVTFRNSHDDRLQLHSICALSLHYVICIYFGLYPRADYTLPSNSTNSTTIQPVDISTTLPGITTQASDISQPTTPVNRNVIMW